MKSIVSLSGGMDSATVLGWLLDQGREVESVSFTYGSKHGEYEQASARALASFYSVKYRVVNLSQVFSELGFVSNLLKSGGEIPEGHYNDASMSQTVVPGRNIIFLALLSGFAWSVGAKSIGIGIHQGDHAIYPDCRAEFYTAMHEALLTGTDNRVRIEAPFLNTDKAGILHWGLSHGVPYQFTRTCYKDQLLSCGKCGSCVERLEAFAAVGQRDPVPYE